MDSVGLKEAQVALIGGHIGLAWAQVACISWGQDRHVKGQIIRGKDMSRHAWRQSAMSCTKLAELIVLPFGFWTRVAGRKHKFNRIRQVGPLCLMGGHIGATWRIQLNSPSAAAMRPYVKLLWSLVCTIAAATPTATITARRTVRNGQLLARNREERCVSSVQYCGVLLYA